jgi:hypothetical protein
LLLTKGLKQNKEREKRREVGKKTNNKNASVHKRKEEQSTHAPKCGGIKEFFSEIIKNIYKRQHIYDDDLGKI